MAESPKSLGHSRIGEFKPKASILLVDDNPANLISLRALLGGSEQDLVEAGSGEEAIQWAQSIAFAVILLDVLMPGMSGFETARLLRDNERSRNTPIIFVTANDIDRSQLEEAYGLGAVDLLVKPLLPVVLQAKVRGFVQLFEAKQRAKHEAEQLRLLVQGTSDYAIFMLDPKGYVVTWNSGAERLKGYKAEEIIGQHFSRFYPQEAIDRDWPAYELKAAEKEGRFEDEGWRVRKDGTQFWANVVITALRDDGGKLRGFSKITRDMTERKRAEENARCLAVEATARRVAEENEWRWRNLADALPNLVWTELPDGQCDYLSSQWGTYTGIPESELLGLRWLDRAIHPDDRARTLACWMTAVEDKGVYDLEYRIRRHDGQYRWFKTRGVPIRNEHGKIVKWFGTCTDIQEHKQAEESARYLAEASAVLSTVVDYESTLRKVVNLAVPYFADWSAVDVAIDNGGFRRLAVAHNDAEKIRLAHELMLKYPPDLQSQGGIGAVVRTGKPQMVGRITDEMLVQAANDEQHLQLTRLLGLRSYICVPLVVSGKSLGALTFATAESGRSYTDADLAFANDLAQRAAIAIENTQLYQALREADRRKDEFLATLAHELRNPLAPIRNSLQILKMPRLDAETIERSRDVMERQVHHLVRLVDDLLDVSRVMQGKVELRKELVELATVVARAVETVQPLIEVQGHELSVSVSPQSMPLRVDPVRLAQVIGNLLTNAAKYTEPGGRIRLIAGRQGNEAVLRIKDNGIGIATDMLPHVFELFVQVDQAATRSQGGLGIGLTLVKSLVEMHGGTVEAHSEGLEKGSEFVVRLPISSQTPQEDSTAGPEQTARSTLSTGFRLLVVDDNQDAASTLAMLLKLQGHEVQMAHSGPAALEMVKRSAPDVVFLDIGMPDMDGYEVARRIRQEPGLERIVLAALTGWGQQEDRRRTAEAGFDHHLVKPPEPSALNAVLAALKRRTS